ncbi:MAG: V-type ATP synthase subunit D [Nitrososphaerales archaeon]
MSVSFGRKFLPTKIELIRIKRSLSVARSVYKILEDKREVLLKRLDELIEQAGAAREELWGPLLDAYRALFDSYLKLGSLTVESVAATIPKSTEVSLTLKRIIDVTVPALQFNEKSLNLGYGFADTNSALDEAFFAMRRVLPAILKAAEIENSIFRLASELERTQRLLNALEFIIIPQYEEAVRSITSTLDEREREDFVRLKKIKKVLELRKSRSGV